MTRASSKRSFWKIPTCSNMTSYPRRLKNSLPLRPTNPRVQVCALPST